MKILLLLALAYGALVLIMYSVQSFLVFPGARLPSRPLDHPVMPERMVLEPETGVALHGMIYAPKDGRDGDAKELLIGFGGNAQDADELGQDLTWRFPAMHVAVFHYRGFGPSSGRPSEQALFADALSIYDRLQARLMPERVFAYGVSLGSGVAAYLASERNLDGAFLITPYDSIVAVAKDSYPWLPVDLLMKHRFPSIDLLRGQATPIAIIAAEQDQVVKPARTEVLRTAIGNLVFDQTIRGAGHADIYGMPGFDKAVGAALDALNAAEPVN